jgi:uncharacterized membrane protein
MVDESPKAAAHTSLYDETVFKARLHPNRSMSVRQMALVIGAVMAVSAILSVPFFILGAWPIVGFFGIDVLLLYVAFRVCHARAKAYEELVLTRPELLIRNVSHTGRTREWRFNPFWARLEREDDEDFGTLRLAVVEGRRMVPVGIYLGAAEKAAFAGTLQAALQEARQGPTYNP